MNDNLKKGRTRVTKGKAKLTMATKKGDATKARTCVTKGISVGKNQCNSSTFKGKNDFSIGAGKEVSVNPSSLDFPMESRASNIPYSEDEIKEILGEFHDHELCCKNQWTMTLPTMSWLTERKSPSPPPPESVLLERKEEHRKWFQKKKRNLERHSKSQARRRALALEYRNDFLVRFMSPVFITDQRGQVHSKRIISLNLPKLIRLS